MPTLQVYAPPRPIFPINIPSPHFPLAPALPNPYPLPRRPPCAYTYSFTLLPLLALLALLPLRPALPRPDWDATVSHLKALGADLVTTEERLKDDLSE